MSGIPSLSSLPQLLARVSQRYESAVKANSVYFYPSKVSILGQDLPGSSKSTHLPWAIRCVPALLDKAKEKKQKSSRDIPSDALVQPTQNPHDVFAPPYHPDLLIEELSQHTLLLNKFCVVPKHFLLVTKEFQPQTMPPSPELLAIAYRILSSHRLVAQHGSLHASPNKELLAFYNCGEASGASQPHQHVQFAELGEEDSLESKATAIPIEQLLERIPRDGKEEEHIHALPLPYQHFVALLSKAPLDDEDALKEYLGMKLLTLLDSMFQARLSAAVATDSESKRASPSWNLLMTTRAMHLIPRKQESFDGLREMATKDGTGKEEDGVPLVGALSVNSLGYAGHLLVKSEDELEHLQRYPGGVIDILRNTGVAPVADVTTALHHEQ